MTLPSYRCLIGKVHKYIVQKLLYILQSQYFKYNVSRVYIVVPESDTSPINNQVASPMFFFPFELKVADRNNLIQRAWRRLKYSIEVVYLFLTGLKCNSGISKKYSYMKTSQEKKITTLCMLSCILKKTVFQIWEYQNQHK